MLNLYRNKHTHLDYTNTHIQEQERQRPVYTYSPALHTWGGGGEVSSSNSMHLRHHGYLRYA